MSHDRTPGRVGKSRRDATFIESSIPIDLGSPFMAERRLVALLKELPSLIGVVWFSINISPLRGFSDRLGRGARPLAAIPYES